MKRVFVSGGSGYIALHCIKKLLLRGYCVRTSVRSNQKITLIKTSLDKLNITTKNIDFCILDLLKDDGWDNATKNCDYVIHTASPVIPGKVKSELVVKPAVEGLKRCLNSALKNNVKKFVLTSSYAAIYGNSKNEYNDNDWTDLGKKDLLPYEISKTMSEQEMWNIVKESKNKIYACAINPVLVLGPSLSDVISITNKLTIKKILKFIFIPKVRISIIGVNDVAEAHILAMESAKANGKRFLISEKTVDLVYLANLLNKSGHKRKPYLILPNFIVKILSIFSSYLKLIAKRLGNNEKLHTNNLNRILGLYPNSVDDEIISSAEQILKKNKYI